MERRLTAIVAADVVDYSRLLGEDAAATLAALEQVRRLAIEPALAGSSGRIFRLLGDGTLIGFGSVLEAVEFAISLQRGIVQLHGGDFGKAPLQYRVGVNLGDVVLSGGELHGDGINIAVRLEALAPPGGICVSQAVLSQINGDLASSFEPLGLRQLKNIAEPVAVWRWPASASAPIAGASAGPAQIRNASGQQILDPKVARLLVQLHMRSARLALLEAVDDVLAEPGAGQGLELGDLYGRLGNNLNQARALLACVNVQCVDNITDYSGGKWPPHMPMSEFISGVFDSADTSYAMKLLPRIKTILDSAEQMHNKRREMMQLFNQFMNADMIPRVELLMKYAFVEL